MAQWHGLAKLRLHTEETLIYLDKLTTALGDQLRKFKKRTCSLFETKELPREVQAREKKKIKKATKESAGTPAPEPEAPASKSTKRLLREFKLNTYKNHSLGDYVESIRRYGTTDLYSTEAVRSNPLLRVVNSAYLVYSGRARASHSKGTVSKNQQKILH